MDQCVLDMTIFKELQETTGAEFVVDLTNSFIEDGPKMLQTLVDAVEKNDAVAFRRAAHSIKANANTFGAVKLSALARDLELNGIPEKYDAATISINSLYQAFKDAEKALRAIHHG